MANAQFDSEKAKKGWGGHPKVPVTGKCLQLIDMCVIKQQGNGGTFKCFCASVGSLKRVIERRNAGCQMTAGYDTHLGCGRRRMINGIVINGVQSCQATSFAGMRE